MTETTTRAGAPTATPNWMRLGRAAAVTMIIWSILVPIFAREVIPPVLIIGLVYLGFAPFLKGERRKLGLALAAFTVLAIAGNLPRIIDDLANPDSTPAFVLQLLSVSTAAVAVGAGLGAGVGWVLKPIRPVAVAWAAVFVVGALASVVAGASAASDDLQPGDVIVTAERVEFVPVAFEAKAGTTAFWVDNTDGIRHTFTIEELGVDLEIPALKARRVDADLVPGTFTVICTVPGHESMSATLTVTS